MVTEPVFDADHHYYEALDAFTRHVPEDWQPRCVQPVQMDGRTRHIDGGRINRTVTNPTFGPIVKPGAMMDRLLWVGPDDRGVELEIVALDLPDEWLVIHVMPTV